MEGILVAPTGAAVEPSLEYVLIFCLKNSCNLACYFDSPLIDDSFAVCRRRCRGRLLWEGPWVLSADEGLDARVDLFGDAEPRPSEGEELDAFRDAAENLNDTVAAAGAGEDVENRPVAVEKPIAGHNLCDDVMKASATAID